MACPFKTHQVRNIRYGNAVIAQTGGDSFLTFLLQCHGSCQLLLRLPGPLAQGVVDSTINLSRLSRCPCESHSLCEEMCPRVSVVPSSPCGTPAVLQEKGGCCCQGHPCAAVEGMAQPLSAPKHHLLPRLAETLQTATSPGRASLGVVPDCHVLIRKLWRSLC